MAEYNSYDNGNDNDSERINAAEGYRFAQKSSNGTIHIDYKRADDLRRFMTPNGKIQGRKRSNLTAREQRMMAAAIKRARYMALLPYTNATL